MTIWTSTLEGLVGGWKTYGPGQLAGPGAFDTPSDGEESVNADSAMKLSAVHACIKLRAEIRGSLPLQIRDKDKNILRDHPLAAIFSVSPNIDQTPAEFWSQQSALVDMKGNAISVIERTAKKVVALTPVDPDDCEFKFNRSGTRKTWKINGDEISDDNVLHLRGFSFDKHWGRSQLDLGRQIIQAQLAANQSALRAFRQGLKVGGFFRNTGTRDYTTDELTQITNRLAHHSKPENVSKWMMLLRGMEPIAGTEFSIKPMETQLLESRYFGIEEICRLLSVPPQLIGHTSKASSWASSIENINLFFLMYALNPALIRDEQRILKKLMSPEDAALGVRAKFNIRGLLRADMKTQTLMFASALQNGYYNQDEVRNFLDEPPLPDGEGQVYRVQLNMSGSADPPPQDTTP